MAWPPGVAREPARRGSSTTSERGMVGPALCLARARRSDCGGCDSWRGGGGGISCAAAPAQVPLERLGRELVSPAGRGHVRGGCLVQSKKPHGVRNGRRAVSDTAWAGRARFLPVATRHGVGRFRWTTLHALDARVLSTPGGTVADVHRGALPGPVPTAWHCLRLLRHRGRHQRRRNLVQPLARRCPPRADRLPGVQRGESILVARARSRCSSISSWSSGSSTRRVSFSGRALRRSNPSDWRRRPRHCTYGR